MICINFLNKTCENNVNYFWKVKLIIIQRFFIFIPQFNETVYIITISETKKLNKMICVYYNEYKQFIKDSILYDNILHYHK